jgi:hypothetical protein
VILTIKNIILNKYTIDDFDINRMYVGVTIFDNYKTNTTGQSSGQPEEATGYKAVKFETKSPELTCMFNSLFFILLI